jgi:hypothetical protein
MSNRIADRIPEDMPDKITNRRPENIPKYIIKNI